MSRLPGPYQVRRSPAALSSSGASCTRASVADHGADRVHGRVTVVVAAHEPARAVGGRARRGDRILGAWGARDHEPAAEHLLTGVAVDLGVAIRAVPRLSLGHHVPRAD